MSNQTNHPVIMPEIVVDSMRVAMQFPVINFELEIKHELEASAQQGVKLIRHMIREAVQEIYETTPMALDKIKKITVNQPIEIRFGAPEITVELK